MRTILFFILFSLTINAFSQQKINTVSVSHYVNPELYIKAGVLCRITDKIGTPSDKGSYLSIYNRSQNSFNFSYPTSNKNWRSLAPKQKVIIPVQRTASVTVVSLKVKYTAISNNNLPGKLRELATLNEASDQLSFKKAPQGILKTQPTATLIRDVSATAKTSPKVKPKKIKPAQKIQGKVVQNETPLQKDLPIQKEDLVQTSTGLNTNCISTSKPEYYTFYYLKVNNELLYSDVFAVPAYTNEDEGQELLEQAWFCFVIALRAHYTEKRVDELLNDRDNDLQLGLTHLRDPFIPSANIFQTYPYTNTLKAAESELKSWLEYDREKYPELRFVRIQF